MLVKKLKDSRQSGFTIIEVMIVLGIAAAIMLIVLIAIPQLQRNQRNTARKDVLGRISTEVNNYAGNNNGSLPAATGGTGGTEFGSTANAASFAGRYLTNTNITDPRTGLPYRFIFATPATLDSGGNSGQVVYMTGNICNGESPTTTGASPRNFALQMALEGGAFFCVDNR